jgi:hypothetical protein
VKSALTSETIFKYINIVIVLILLFCIKGFLLFREYCIGKGYYVFSIDSLIWCAVGFAGIFVIHPLSSDCQVLLLCPHEEQDRNHHPLQIRRRVKNLQAELSPQAQPRFNILQLHHHPRIRSF